MSDYVPHEVAWTPEKIGRVWDFYGGSEAFRADYFSAHSGAAIVDRVDRELHLAGKRILDFGCGRGDLLARLYARGWQATGLEFSDESAQIARDRLSGANEFGGVVVADRLPSNLSDAAFDVVLLIEVVEHLLEEQLAPTFAEVRRLLVTGGAVVVTTPNGEDLARERVRCPDCGATFHRWQHTRSLTPQSGRTLLEAHGFEPRIAEGVNWGLVGWRRLRQRLTGGAAPHMFLVGVKPDSAR